MNLRDHDEHDAHRLYEAAIHFAAMGLTYSDDVRKAVADALRFEASHPNTDAPEREVITAMVKFLETED